MRKMGWLAALLIVGVMVPASAAVGVGYLLFGDGGDYISPGDASNRAVRLTSNTSKPFGGIDYAGPAGHTFDDVERLSTSYRFERGSCGGGSPRFQINVRTPSDGVKNIFVYIGPPPNYTGCPTAMWTNTGNLLETGKTVDTSQLGPALGGTFYDPYDAALAKYGDYPVVGIQLVADGAGMFPTAGQVVDIDNTKIRGKLFDYEFTSKDDCKRGGWENFTYPPGPFKNQGQCVSYFAKQKN